MAENDTPEGAPGGAAAAAEAGGAPQIRVLVQYVKDMSFENPNAPQSFDNRQGNPNINVGVDVQARARGEGAFEADLKITTRADRGEQVIFIGELVYSGLFQFINVPQQSIQPALLIECPRLLFPFARRIMSDMTRDGGFPPLMLEPVDFAAMYRQQQTSAQGQQTGNGAPDTAET